MNTLDVGSKAQYWSLTQGNVLGRITAEHVDRWGSRWVLFEVTSLTKSVYPKGHTMWLRDRSSSLSARS